MSREKPNDTDRNGSGHAKPDGEGRKYGTHGNDKHMYLVKEYVKKGLKGDGAVTLETEAQWLYWKQNIWK